MNIKLTESTVNDIKELPTSTLQSLCMKQLARLEKYGVTAGQSLGNLHDMDLTGYSKIYFGDGSTHRIIYKVDSKNIIIVVGVGQRKNMDIYRLVHHRENE